jgi:hypothetical protein
MDREILGIFLQSGPARKFDVSRFTRMIATSESADQSFLFRNKFLNYAILFKHHPRRLRKVWAREIDIDPSLHAV